MSRITLTVEHDGTEYVGEIMTIESTRFGWEDHGILTAHLHCKYDGGGVGVGGFCLDVKGESDSFSHVDRVGTAYGLDHLMKLMVTVGVTSWEALPGTDVIVLSTGEGGWGSMSLGIAGLKNGRVLLLKEHAEAWRTQDAGAES